MYTKENIEQAKTLIIQFIKTPNDYFKVKELEKKFSLTSFVMQQCKRYDIPYDNISRKLMTCRVINEQQSKANYEYKRIMLL